MKIFQTINQLKYYTNQFLEHSRKVHTPFTDNIWGAYFANMQIISKFDQGICFLSWVIDNFSKYAWVFTLTFIRTVKNKVYMYISLISKNTYIDELYWINTIIKMTEKLKWSLLM